MTHTWKYAFGLGLVGAALTVSCVVKNGDDDAGAGQSGEGGSGAKGGTGGTTGGAGGSSAKGGSGGTGGSAAGTGGTGGTTAGTAGIGGTATTGGAGGTVSSGGTGDVGMAGAETGGSSGTGGSTSGTGGSTGGTEADTSPTCDPTKGSTPYPSCAPSAGMEKDACALCVQAHCCDESNNCYATAPYNVCGWGGPLTGDYAGEGEIGCYTTCLSEYVTENGVCDKDGIDACTTMCTTEMCGLVGDATSELATCMQASCASECFGAETCD